MQRRVNCYLGSSALALLIACGAGTERSLADAKKAPGATLGTPGATGDFIATTPGPGTNPDGTCAAQVTEARRGEVDVIVIIDTSGSMDEETAQVQQNMNSFAQTIGQSGLDYRVIMIADKFKPPPFPFVPGSGICVPPPLAGANCGDNPPLYRHITEEVGSKDSLHKILQTYDSTWHQWARPTATKVFIEITDDNSDLDWASFDQQLLAKAPAGMFGSQGQRKYIFNSICGWAENTPALSGGNCNSAENNGDQYQHLSQLTNGVIDSVCKKSYANVFGKLADGLITALGCTFGIPGAQSGPVDPTKVVVRYTKAGAAAAELTQVTDPSKCGTIAGAWYFNDNQNPGHIVFCPDLCNTAGKDTTGKVEVAVGCKAPPPR
jgi:hypothetical protein